MAGGYPSVCQQLTGGCAPAVCSISAVAVDFDAAAVATLCVADARADHAVLSSLFVESGALGVVNGLGKVAVQSLTVGGGVNVGGVAATSARFGSLAKPSTTSIGGVAVQSAALVFPAFVQCNLPPTTPHLAQIVAASPVYPNGTVLLPDSFGVTPFPPPGYRLFVHNLDAAGNSILVRSAASSIQRLDGVASAPSPSLVVPGQTTASIVWTGSVWLASTTGT